MITICKVGDFTKIFKKILFRICLFVLFILFLWIYFFKKEYMGNYIIILFLILFLWMCISYLFYIIVEKNKNFNDMTGEEFELYLKKRYEKKGYNVKLTSVTGDYGADLVIHGRGEKFIVQAKRYSKKVGIKAVQEAIGAINYYNADYAVVITNSEFTNNAISLAQMNEDVLLVDNNSLDDYFR